MIRNLMGGMVVALVMPLCAWSDGGKGDAKMLDGTWVPEKAELGGKPFPDELLKNLRLILKGDKYAVKAGEVNDEGIIKLDASKTPKTMDITGTDGPNKGKRYPAIYELKGDSLRVCYDLDGTERPAEFKTKKDSQQFLVRYKRDKPK